MIFIIKLPEILIATARRMPRPVDGDERRAHGNWDLSSYAVNKPCPVGLLTYYSLCLLQGYLLPPVPSPLKGEGSVMTAFLLQ